MNTETPSYIAELAAAAARQDAEEGAYAAALAALWTHPDVATVARQHGLDARELVIRAAFADCELLGVRRHAEIAAAYGLDEDAALDLRCRLVEADYDIELTEAPTYAN